MSPSLLFRGFLRVGKGSGFQRLFHVGGCQRKELLRLPEFSVFSSAARDSSATAITDTTRTLSYGQLLRAVSRLSHTIPSGTRVAFLFPRNASYVVAQWAVWARQAVAVPLCTSHPSNELAHIIEDSQPSLLLYAPEFASTVQQVKRVIKLGNLNQQIVWKECSDEMLFGGVNTHNQQIKVEWEPIDKSQGALIVYTSGTTGKPKGVVSSFSNIEAQVSSLLQAWKWSSTDKILLVLPLHHIHGIINVVTCALTAGAVLEMAPEKLSPQQTWSRFTNPSRDLTLFMAVPTIYARLLEHYDSCSLEEQVRLTQACSQFRLMVSGSAALPLPVFQKWETVSGGHKLLERYGMTEIGMALGNPYDGPREPGKVGVPFPGVETKIIDDNGRNVVSVPEASGELFVRGPQVFKEYWNNPSATKKAFTEGGWFATGDIAAVTLPNHTYKILGRASVDIIKSGGFKLSALTIEREILSLPGVRDAAVLGVPDSIWGERVGAIVVLDPAKDNTSRDETDNEAVALELKASLAAKLAKYEIPSLWHFCDSIPRNAMLKVNKKQLVSMFSEK